VGTVAALQDKIAVSPAAIAEGLSTVQWPGRLQLVTRPGGQKILLDGAHNRAGVETLRAALMGAPSQASAQGDLSAKHAGSETGAPTLILGVLADKDWRAMCEMLAPLAARIATVTVGSERTTSAAELAAACREANPAAEVFECASLRAALKQTARDPFVVITGSLYLVGEALEFLELSAEAGTGERTLNEWGGAKPGKLPQPPG
jgi:dihydrofolate synthase/folylpolyglutamate synthase